MAEIYSEGCRSSDVDGVDGRFRLLEAPATTRGPRLRLNAELNSGTHRKKMIDERYALFDIRNKGIPATGHTIKCNKSVAEGKNLQLQLNVMSINEKT